MIFPQSSRVGISPLTFAISTLRVSSCARLAMISPKPNTPIATVTKLMPSASSGTPKL